MQGQLDGGRIPSHQICRLQGHTSPKNTVQNRRGDDLPHFNPTCPPKAFNRGNTVFHDPSDGCRVGKRRKCKVLHFHAHCRRKRTVERCEIKSICCLSRLSGPLCIKKQISKCGTHIDLVCLYNHLRIPAAQDIIISALKIVSGCRYILGMAHERSPQQQP